MSKRIIIMVKKIFDVFFMTVIYIISFFVKRNDKFIAFGSWVGELYIDNSRYLAEYMEKEEPDYTLFWVGKKEVKKEIPRNSRIHFLELNSIKAIFMLLMCKYMFCTQMHTADLSKFNVFRGAIICYLHHGVPVKKCGDDVLNKVTKKKLLKKIIAKLYHSYFGIDRTYEYFVSTSPLQDISNCTALAFRGCSMRKNIPSGMPRNDMLINYNCEKSKVSKEYYADKLGFDFNKKVIMYFPTYRRTDSEMFSFFNCKMEDIDAIEQMLKKNNAILLEKSHFATKQKTPIKTLSTTPKNVYKINQDVNIQEMLLFTDVVISDYSGVFLDFILMNRPVVHFAYDYEYYNNVDSGLYYDIDDFAAGKVTNTLEETLEEVNQLLLGIDEFSDKRAYVRRKYMGYEVGRASQKIVEAVIYGKGRET